MKHDRLQAAREENKMNVGWHKREATIEQILTILKRDETATGGDIRREIRRPGNFLASSIEIIDEVLSYEDMGWNRTRTGRDFVYQLAPPPR